MGAALGVLLGTAVMTTPALGQDLARRVAAVEGGVLFQFATRPGIYRCGNGSQGWSYTDNEDWRMRPGCVGGPAWVWMEVEDGEPMRLRAQVGGFEGRRSGEDLGDVPPSEAADFLMGLAEGADPRLAERALGAAVMARDVELGDRLLGLARDTARPQKVRTSAVFWLGQAATDRALEGLRGLVADDPDLEVREAAVFAISQREGDEAFPILRDIALSDAHPEVRSSAFFWLAQMDDPRVLDLFEEILRR